MRWCTRSEPAACCGTGFRSASKAVAWSPPPGANALTSPGISRLWKSKAPPIRTYPYGKSRAASGWRSAWWTCRVRQGLAGNRLSRQKRLGIGGRNRRGSGSHKLEKPRVIQSERRRIAPEHPLEQPSVLGHDVLGRIKAEREVLRGHRRLRMRQVIRREPRDDVHPILVVEQYDRQHAVLHEQRACRDIAAIRPPPFRHV